MLPEAERQAGKVERRGDLPSLDPAEPQIRTIPAQEPDAFWPQMKCDLCSGEALCDNHWLSLRVAWVVCGGNWFRPKTLTEVVKGLK